MATQYCYGKKATPDAEHREMPPFQAKKGQQLIGIKNDE
jgi:hypothetical protein